MPVIDLALKTYLVNVRLLASDVQDWFLRGDAAVNLRRQHEANKGVGKGNQVGIRRDEEACNVLKWYKVASALGYSCLAEEGINCFNRRAHGIHPQDDPSTAATV